MKKVLKFNVPQEHYSADATIIWCFDDRFSNPNQDLLGKLIKARRFKHIDVIKIAGGAKEYKFILGQIEASIRLHHPKEIILMLHEDCGAYGKTYKNRGEMVAFLTGQLKLAEKAVKNRLKIRGKLTIPITKYIAAFDGVYKI